MHSLLTKQRLMQARVQNSQNDEFGRLVDRFNNMLAEIEQRDQNNVHVGHYQSPQHYRTDQAKAGSPSPLGRRRSRECSSNVKVFALAPTMPKDL